MLGDGGAPGLLNLDLLCSDGKCVVHLHAEIRSFQRLNNGNKFNVDH